MEKTRDKVPENGVRSGTGLLVIISHNGSIRKTSVLRTPLRSSGVLHRRTRKSGVRENQGILVVERWDDREDKGVKLTEETSKVYVSEDGGCLCTYP